MLLPDKISSSWKPFLTEDIMNMLEEIEEAIGEDYTPSKDKILRFLTLDLNKMNVCILGQDVYFQPEAATGRSFEVSFLNNWSEKFKQVSLKNMIRLIHKSYNHYEHYDSINKYSEIVKDIENGNFPILQPHEWFESMENQGVLFLNSYFTCKIGKANSHRKIWTPFSIELFKFISDVKPDLIWFLWGNEAIEKKAYITKGQFYESRHPMMCSKKYDNDFLKSKCFLETEKIINWLGQ